MLDRVLPNLTAGSERTRARRRRSSGAGQLTSVVALPSLDRRSWVLARPATSAQLLPESVGGNRLVVELSDRRILMPEAMRAAVDLLLGDTAVQVGELPGLDDPSRLVLVRRLIREGVVAVADPVAGW